MGEAEKPKLYMTFSPPLGAGDSCHTAMAEMFYPGKCVVGHVTDVRGDEVTVDLPEGAVGRATTHTAHGEYRTR